MATFPVLPRSASETRFQTARRGGPSISTRAEPADKLPPGLRTPAALQLIQYTLSPGPFLEHCARRLGDPFTMRLAGYGNFVMLSSPDAIKDVFRSDDRALHSGEANAFLKPVVGANSVLVLDEEPHRAQRRILMPPLQGDRMRAFTDAMRTTTQAVLAKWPLDKPFRIDQPMREITLRVILRAVMGLDEHDPKSEALAQRMQQMLRFAATPYAIILSRLLPHGLEKHLRWAPVFRQIRAVDELLYESIGQRRSVESQAPDVLSTILQSRHQDGSATSDQEARDALITVLTAGYETTSTALAWTFERILAHPHVAERIRAELHEVVGGDVLLAEHLPRLPYLDAAIKESLRARTVVPFVLRLLREPFVAGGRTYPSGVFLAPCIHLVHRRPDIYPDPEQFRPERFLDRKPTPYEWLPFGGGNRMCTGMAFALYEMKVVLATVFSCLRLQRPPGARTHVVRRGVLMAPSDGTRVVVVDRQGSMP